MPDFAMEGNDVNGNPDGSTHPFVGEFYEVPNRFREV